MSKVQFIRVVVTDAEKKLLQNAAAIDGLKLSPWARTNLLGIAKAKLRDAEQALRPEEEVQTHGISQKVR
jgi:hypothetical protein